MCCSTCGSKVGGRDVREVWRLCLWLIVESRMANLKAQTSSDSSLQRLQYSALGVFNTVQAGLYICWYRQEKRFRASVGIDKQ